LLGKDFVERLSLASFAKAGVQRKSFPYCFLILPPRLQEEGKRIITERMYEKMVRDVVMVRVAKGKVNLERKIESFFHPSIYLRVSCTAILRDPSQSVRIVSNPLEPTLKIYVISPAAWTVSENLVLDHRLPKFRG
jgi:hypothetical protein